MNAEHEVNLSFGSGWMTLSFSGALRPGRGPTPTVTKLVQVVTWWNEKFPLPFLFSCSCESPMNHQPNQSQCVSMMHQPVTVHNSCLFAVIAANVSGLPPGFH